MIKIMNVVLISTVSLLFTACTNSSLPAPVETPSFKQGSQDGCRTARGTYTKSSDSFNSDKDYHDGWFYGRRKCNRS